MKRHGLKNNVMLVLLAAMVLMGTAMAQYDQGPPPNDQQQNYPPQQGGYPPQDQGAYPQQYPPQQGGYPDQGGYSQQPQQNPYPQQNQANQQDPSSRVVRLKYMSGSVSMQPGGVNDWVQAVLNRPLTTSDRIWTDRDSRAELTLDTGALRMNGETSVTFTNVNDNTTQIELDQGVLELTVFRLYPGEIYEIDTPNMAFTITKPGEYRFDVLSDADETWVTVRHGEGTATGNGPGLKVSYGQQARFYRGTSMEHDRRRAPDRDGFDDWCQVRDKREQNGTYTRYVPPGTIGAEDLDQYGSWRTYPDYGPVWFPQVAPGWAPYHYGHWVWIDPWGWTWVDDAPWGFAPFHYGRWAYVGGGWGWCPGPYYGSRWGYARPVYAPALVAWVGGGNWGVSFGVGPAVGWFPLGWREPYYPAYRVSNRYVTNVNVTNTRIVNVTNVVNNYNTRNVTNVRYANRDVPGAMIAMRRDAMVHAQPVARNVVRIDQKQWRDAPVMHNPGAAPDRASVLGMHAGERSAVPPSKAVDRQVVRQITPPPRAQRTVFADREDNRRPGMGNTGNVQRGGAPNSNVTPPRAGAPVNAPAPESVAGPGRGNVSNDNRQGRGNAVNDNAPGRPARNVPRPPSAGGAPVAAPSGNVAPSSPSSGRRPVYTNDNIGREPASQGGNVAPTAPSGNRRTVYTNDNVSTPRTGPEGTPRGTVAPENPRPSAPPVSNAPATMNRQDSTPRAPQATEAPRNVPSQAPQRAPEASRPAQGQGREAHRPAEGNKQRQESHPKENDKPRDNRSSYYGNDGTYSARAQGYAERGSYSPAPSYSARGAYSSASSTPARSASPAPSYGERGSYSPAAESGRGAHSAPAVRATPSNGGGRGGNAHNGGSRRG